MSLPSVQDSNQTLAQPEEAPSRSLSIDENETKTEPRASSDRSIRDDDSADADSHSQEIPIDQDRIDWSQYTLKKRPWRPRVTDFAAIVQGPYRGKGTPSEPFIVQWLDHDPENPKNYEMWLKCCITALVSFMTLGVSLASSAYTGAARQIIPKFHCSEEVFLLGLSFMVIGFATGPLLFAPLSEALGRRHVFLVSLVFYTMWTAVCIAAQNIQTLIVFRFFCGMIGSSAFVIPGGQVADLFDAQ